MLTAGIWIAAHVQASQRGIGYVGTQGAVVVYLDPGSRLGAAGRHFSGVRSLCRHHRRTADPAGRVMVDGAVNDPGSGRSHQNRNDWLTQGTTG
jgi:hypothetical protein